MKWIEKKDLVYWVIIIGLIWILTSNMEIPLAKWSFASTISSIVLAVIAIIYSYEQNSASLTSIRLLEESAKKIGDASSKIEEISIDQLFSILEAKIEVLNRSMDESIKNNLDSQYKNFESLFHNNKKKSGKLTSHYDFFSEEDWRKYIQENIIEYSSIGGIVLTLCYFAYKGSFAFSIGEFTNFLLQKAESEFDIKEAHCLIAGASEVYESFGVIKLNPIANIQKNTVNEIASEFLKVMDEFSDNGKLEDLIMVKDIREFVNSINN